MDLSIVIPAHNEEARIGPTLRDYAAEFHASYGERWELLVVLNGCTDDTRRVVDEAAAECPAIRWSVEDETLGKGAAVRTGLREATGARVAFVDADNMVGPLEARKLLDALGDHDLAVGWRKPELALELAVEAVGAARGQRDLADVVAALPRAARARPTVRR